MKAQVEATIANQASISTTKKPKEQPGSENNDNAKQYVKVISSGWRSWKRNVFSTNKPKSYESPEDWKVVSEKSNVAKNKTSGIVASHHAVTDKLTIMAICTHGAISFAERRQLANRSASLDAYARVNHRHGPSRSC